jgi:guanylate kinase
LLFIEVTASNNWAESARKSGHLTPGFLERELTAFKKIKGYLPQVIAVHINPPDEEDIRSELAAVAKSLGTDVRLAYEGMELSF